MKASEFCYWLQGYFEIAEDQTPLHDGLNELAIEKIKRHLSLVFVHDLDPAQVADKLQQIHDGDECKPIDFGNSTKMRC